MKKQGPPPWGKKMAGCRVLAIARSYTISMENEALERVQIKIAYLERANAELSDVVFRQQQELQALAAQIRELADRLQTAQTPERARTLEDERPPHY
jgi:SlyX protein